MTEPTPDPQPEEAPSSPPEMTPALLPTAPPERQGGRGPSPVSWVISLVLASMVGALLFGAGYLAAGGAQADGSCSAPTAAFAPLCEAYDKLKAQYVDKLDDTQLVEGAIKGLFEYGVKDPHSGYMTPDEYQHALGSLSGEFSGIGAEMSVKNLTNPADLASCTKLSATCVLVVVAPLADSPAEAAGLQPGDIVLAIDGVSVNGSTLQDEVGKVRGEAGTKVTLSLKRGDRTFDHGDHPRQDHRARGDEQDARREDRVHRPARLQPRQRGPVPHGAQGACSTTGRSRSSSTCAATPAATSTRPRRSRRSSSAPA